MVLESEKIVVVGDAPTCTGFRLAGINDVFPLEGKEAAAKIDELLSLPDVGIIIMNEKILGQLDSKLKKRIDKIAKPVVIGVPDKSGPMEQVDSLKNLVKKALGFELIK
mgnify:CR=1 FL=1